jgi:hypothetical protein
LTGDLTLDGNTALTFDPSTPTPVTVKFNDPNLATANYFQLAARTTNGSLFSLSNVKISFDNVTYSVFDTGTQGTDFSPTYNYGAIQNIASSSADVYFQYELPSGLDIGSITQVALYANSNSDVDGSGVLADTLTNGFVNLVRTHTAVDVTPPPVPEPATMTIAVFGLGLAGAARLRKRLSKKS